MFDFMDSVVPPSQAGQDMNLFGQSKMGQFGNNVIGNFAGQNPITGAAAGMLGGQSLSDYMKQQYPKQNPAHGGGILQDIIKMAAVAALA